MTAKVRSKTSEGIVLIRPLLILFVVLVHLPFFNAVTLMQEASPVSFAGVSIVFLKETFSKGAMPFLSLLSGYLAIKSYYRDGYTKNMITKAQRLLVPMFWANIFLLIWVVYPVQSVNPAYRADLAIAPFDLWGWIQACFGIYKLPANQPLYFLKDLFTCFLLLPLLLLTLKYRWLSVLVWLWMAVKSLMVWAVFLIPYFPFYFFRFDIIFAFYTGMLCYHWHSKLLFSDKKFCFKVIIGYLLFCVISSVIMVALPATEYKFLFLLIKFLVKLLGVFTAVTIMSVLVDYKNVLTTFLRKISKYTFMIFLTHVYSIIILERYYPGRFGVPDLSKLSGWLFVVLLLAFSIVFAAVCYEVWHRLLSPLVDKAIKQLLTKIRSYKSV